MCLENFRETHHFHFSKVVDAAELLLKQPPPHNNTAPRRVGGRMNQADTMANSAAASHSCGDSGGEVKTTTKPRLSSTTEGDNTSCGQQPLPSETASLEQEAFNKKALAQLYHSSRRSRHFRRVSTSSAHAAYGKKLNQEKQLHHDTSHHHQVPAVEEENHTEPSADDVGWSFNIASLVDDCSSISSFGDESVIAVDDGMAKILSSLSLFLFYNISSCS